MATTSAAARESRRRKLVDRGADRLALITGRIESLPPDSSNNPIADSSQPTISPDPPTHLADQRTMPSSIKDEDFSSVLPNLAVAADTDDGGSGVEFPLRDIGISICSIDKEADALSETRDLCIGVGRITLMCGDGTNDVGALKQAHVGVALLNAVPPPTQSGSSSSETPKDGSKPTKPKKSKSTPEGPDRSDSSSQPPPNRHLTAAELQRQKLKKMMDEMNDDADGRSAPIVKLGDASMASPFTAKHASVAPTTDVIRQGRSTLVTTLQMFKILGLNCLATAYVLSVMYLDGVKLGDVQATISGIFTASFFLFISHARPLPTLSAERPHPNIFCFYVFLSLMGQFAIHLLFLISSVKGAEKYMPEECIEPDSDFHPNLVNTVSYMVSMMLQLATFAVNYMGHPFNQSITENKPFFYALFSAAGFFTIITSDLFRGLNDWLKLVPLPPGLRNKLLIWAILMFLSCYTWERFLRWVFPGKIPSWRKHQRSAATNLEKKHV